MSEEMLGQEGTVPLRAYTAALDEIYALRRALAYEAQVIWTHTNLITFPKSRRPIADAQMERMKGAARGEVIERYGDIGHASLDNAVALAGAKQTLTRYQWEAEKPWL